MNLTCYIVDDEMHAIEVLKDYIERTPGLELFGYSTNPLRALAEISVPDAPDITFADVDMPGLNGLEFAGLVSAFTKVIFTTAYREYAVEAFEKHAADYLVKPIFYERFLASVQRVRLVSAAIAADFFVTTGIKNKLVRVTVADIRYVKGADAYVEIFLQEGKIMTYMTLSQVIKRLPGSFSRIHKSYIVNDALVDVIEPGQVRLSDKTEIPIGPAYRKAFQGKMNP